MLSTGILKHFITTTEQKVTFNSIKCLNLVLCRVFDVCV